MWETIKNDPILKTVTIIILSVLGFGFAFNIMFGSGNGGMGDDGGMGGVSLGNNLSYIFILAFKLLLIVLVVAALIAIFKFIRNHLIEGGEMKMFESIKKDPVLKGITVVALLIVGFSLIHFLFSSILGLGNGYGTMNGSSMMGSGYGFSLVGLLTIILNILLVASVAGVIIGFVMYIKQNFGKEIADKISSVKVTSSPSISCPECNATVPNDYKFCPQCGTSTKEQCTSCGGELKKEWKCCPVCGNERGTGKKEQNQNESSL